MNTLGYVPLPTVCTECLNRAIVAASEQPEQGMLSVYCEHSHSLLTGYMGDHEGQRIIYSWSVTSPISEKAAWEGLRRQAEAHGIQTAVTHDGGKLN